MLRIRPELLAELDAYIGSKFEGVSRPEAIRRIIALAVFNGSDGRA
jgi:hypothetical protein